MEVGSGGVKSWTQQQTAEEKEKRRKSRGNPEKNPVKGGKRQKRPAHVSWEKEKLGGGGGGKKRGPMCPSKHSSWRTPS